MTVTRIAVVLGLAAFCGLCALAIAGSAPAAGVVLTIVALVVLVGGGNWLSGRRPPSRAPAGPASSRIYGVDLPGGGPDAAPGPGAGPDARTATGPITTGPAPTGPAPAGPTGAADPGDAHQ